MSLSRVRDRERATSGYSKVIHFQTGYLVGIARSRSRTRRLRLRCGNFLVLFTSKIIFAQYHTARYGGRAYGRQPRPSACIRLSRWRPMSRGHLGDFPVGRSPPPRVPSLDLRWRKASTYLLHGARPPQARYWHDSMLAKGAMGGARTARATRLHRRPPRRELPSCPLDVGRQRHSRRQALGRAPGWRP